MGAKSQSSKVYSAPMDYFVQKLRTIEAGGLNVALKSENPTPNGVWFRIHHGVTFTSWGEKITVTLTDLGNGVNVDILSECGMPTQVVDWGKNASNVRAIFEYLEKGLTSSAPSPSAPAEAAPVRAAAPAAGEFKFCSQCGAKLPSAARFCTACGKQCR